MLKIKESCYLGRRLYHHLIFVRSFFKIDRWLSDEKFIKKKYKVCFGVYPNLTNPTKLTEYIQWLKLYERKPLYTILVDKYAVREYIAEKFGDEYLIPLIYQTSNPAELKPENINTYPCIIKSNHDSGFFKILTTPKDEDWEKLRIDFGARIRTNYFTFSREWPYKNINPRRIIVEKLLQTKDGKIPNDYKLHYINGKLQFVYVSYDRQGVNDRCTYDENWNRLPYVWVPKETYRENMNTVDVPCPATFELMKKFANVIAVNFKYVRVDFYDVDGKLYFGEITLYHGSGLDHFFPEKYDEYFGSIINKK